MHENDPEIAEYQKFLAECFVLDETFTLLVGESCRIRDEHVEKLPPSEPGKPGFRYDNRFKLFYKRLDEDNYHWLDNEGNQGVDKGPLVFYMKHWEKV